MRLRGYRFGALFLRPLAIERRRGLCVIGGGPEGLRRTWVAGTGSVDPSQGMRRGERMLKDVPPSLAMRPSSGWYLRVFLQSDAAPGDPKSSGTARSEESLRQSPPKWCTAFHLGW